MSKPVTEAEFWTIKNGWHSTRSKATIAKVRSCRNFNEFKRKSWEYHHKPAPARLKPKPSKAPIRPKQINERIDPVKLACVIAIYAMLGLMFIAAAVSIARNA